MSNALKTWQDEAAYGIARPFLSKEKYLLLINLLVVTRTHLTGSSSSGHPLGEKFKPMPPSSKEASLSIS